MIILGKVYERRNLNTVLTDWPAYIVPYTENKSLKYEILYYRCYTFNPDSLFPTYTEEEIEMMYRLYNEEA